MNIIDYLKKLFGRKEETRLENPGLIDDIKDYRDVPMSAVSKELVDLPESYQTPYKLTIKNQGSTPHCVGFACSSMKDEKERREQNFIDFDGHWIYREAKKIDGIPNTDGTYFRTGLKVLQKIGAKPLDSDEDISKFRIGAYISLPCDEKSLKQALIEFGTILIGFRWSWNGWRTAYIRKPKGSEKVCGHAVVMTGWNKDYLIFQNSWGEKWGDKGYGYFNKNCMPYTAWAILSDFPSNWKELLGKDKPKPKYFFKNNLWRGLRNEEVRILQDCLKFFGCFPPEQKSTGYFGHITWQSVKLFQHRYSISPTSGFFGPLSRDKINKLLKAE